MFFTLRKIVVLELFFGEPKNGSSMASLGNSSFGTFIFQNIWGGASAQMKRNDEPFSIKKIARSVI